MYTPAQGASRGFGQAGAAGGAARRTRSLLGGSGLRGRLRRAGQLLAPRDRRPGALVEVEEDRLDHRVGAGDLAGDAEPSNGAVLGDLDGDGYDDLFAAVPLEGRATGGGGSITVPGFATALYGDGTWSGTRSAGGEPRWGKDVSGGCADGVGAGGDLDGLQKSRKDFIQRFPNSKHAKGIKESIGYYEKDFARARARESTNQASSMSRPYGRSDMPLKVYVHDRLKGRTVWTAGAKKSGEINYSLLIERAMQEWSNSSGRRISFVFTDNVDNANIECLWTTNRNDLHMSFAAGVTSYERNAQNRPRAKIKLMAKTPKNGLTANEFYGVCLHELGHALGLSHSTSTKDIMYFSVTPETSSSTITPSLSRTDIERIIKLYSSM